MRTTMVPRLVAIVMSRVPDRGGAGVDRRLPGAAGRPGGGAAGGRRGALLAAAGRRDQKDHHAQDSDDAGGRADDGAAPATAARAGGPLSHLPFEAGARRGALAVFGRTHSALPSGSQMVRTWPRSTAWVRPTGRRTRRTTGWRLR